MKAYKLSILLMLLVAPMVHSQATFNVQSSGRGLENAKMGARMQQLHDNQQATLDLLQPQSFAVLQDCDALGEKINWNSGTSTFTCVQEDDPTVSSFAKDPLPTCSGTEFLQGDGTDMSCVDATSVVTGAEIDPTVTDFAKDPLPTCGANEALKGNGTVLSCVAISGAGVESDPTVYSFAQNPLPTCGVGQVLRADGTSLSCVADTDGGFTESDPLTMTFAKGTLPVCAADEVLSNTDGLGQAFACVDAATAAAGAADDLGNHTATQALDMAGFGINDVLDPVLAQDAATKAYVDSELSTGLASVSETDPTVRDFAKDLLPTCTGTQLLSGDGSDLSCVDAATAAAGAADDMGDHVADQNIQLGSYYLSKDGDNEGIRVGDDGEVTITKAGSGGVALDVQNNLSTGIAIRGRANGSAGVGLWGESSGAGGVAVRARASGSANALEGDASGTGYGLRIHDGLVAMGSARVQDVADPTAAQDAATKNYVDTLVAGGSGDSGTLDGLDSTQFLRSDVDDATTGDLGVGDADLDGILTVTGSSDISGVNTAGEGHVVIQGNAGDASGRKMRIDANEIQTSDDGSATSLLLNAFGGDVILGDSNPGATNLNMTSGTITYLSDPAADHHAATKAYVDAEVASGGADNLGDHTATQALDMDGNNITDAGNIAANRINLDLDGDANSGFLVEYDGGGLNDGIGLTGHSSRVANPEFIVTDNGSILLGNGVSSTVSFGGNRLQDIDEPTANDDAATKNYVDSAVASGGADNLGDHTATQNVELGSNWLSADGSNSGISYNTSSTMNIELYDTSNAYLNLRNPDDGSFQIRYRNVTNSTLSNSNFNQAGSVFMNAR